MKKLKKLICWWYGHEHDEIWFRCGIVYGLHCWRCGEPNHSARMEALRQGYRYADRHSDG